MTLAHEECLQVGYGSSVRMPGVVRSFGVLLLSVGLAAVVAGCGQLSATPSTTVTYQLVSPDGKPVAGGALDTTRAILSNRIADLGLAGVQVRTNAPDQIQIGLPAGMDRSAIDGITRAGQLAFVPLPEDTYGTMSALGATAVPEVGSQIDPALQPLIFGTQLDAGKVRAENSAMIGQWVVRFGLNESGTRVFADWTKAHVGAFLAITLDGKLLSAPYIAAPILDGIGEISGQFTEASARSLAAVLKYGALPYPLNEIGSKPGW